MIKFNFGVTYTFNGFLLGLCKNELRLIASKTKVCVYIIYLCVLYIIILYYTYACMYIFKNYLHLNSVYIYKYIIYII